MPEQRATRRHLFSNGTERYMWQDRNCDRCWKQAPHDSLKFQCAIESEIVRACALGDGTISERIVERLGWTADQLSPPDCPEREETRPRAARRRGRRVPTGQGAMPL